MNISNASPRPRPQPDPARRASAAASPASGASNAKPALPAKAGGRASAAGNAALSTLSASQRQRLEALFAQRLEAAPIKVVNPQKQQPADPVNVFELRKNGPDYTLAPTVAGAATPAPHGMFMYVILSDDPGRIHVGVPMGSVTVDGGQFGVQGHTSLSQRKDVMYAGELVFDNGKLMSWGNSSGHYKPDQKLRHTNLLPSVKGMLPDDKFIDFWHEMTQAQRDAFLAMRGYTILNDPVPVGNPLVAEPGGAAGDGAAKAPGDASSSLQGDDMLKVGQGKLNIDTLAAMGATLDGVAIRQSLQQGGAASADVADRLSLDGASVARLFQDGSGEPGVAALLDIAAARQGDAPLITPDPSRPWIDAMNQQLDRLKGVEARTWQSAIGNQVTYLLPGGGAVQHLGAGLQAFGVYSALRGIGEAVAKGDPANAAINGAGLAAQAGSLGLEAGLPRLGSHLGKGTSEAFNAFAKTPLGLRLGGQAKLGAGIGQAASAAGAVLTLPFDIYSAVNAFQQAGTTSGKQQQDHIVDGSFATAAALTSVGLAGAAAAGLSAAGPIGIAVGVALAGANHLYHSVRYVEEIERHVPLSHGQRFWTGLSSFFGGTASQAIQDQVSVGQAGEHYRDSKRAQLQAYLQDSTYAHAIFGDASIRAQPPLKHTERKTALAAGGPYTYQVETLTQRPATVRDNAGDDDIDASTGFKHVTNLASATHPAGTSLLWVTGDGNDRLKGALAQRNVFQVGAGEKHYTGGDQEDRFDLVQLPAAGSVLDGGQGHDTLALHFDAGANSAPADSQAAAQPSVRVVLPGVSGQQPPQPVPTDTPGVFYQPSRALVQGVDNTPAKATPGAIEVGMQRATLLNIDNVVTSPTARTTVEGNRNDNVIVLNGDGDSAVGGGGDDSFLMNGAQARIVPGAGSNRYVIGRDAAQVEIDNAQAPDGRHHLQLDVDIGEFSVMAVGTSLEIRLDGSGAPRRIVLGHAFKRDPQGRAEAALADGDVVITTRDGYAITPTLSSVAEHADGMIALVAMDHGRLQGHVAAA